MRKLIYIIIVLFATSLFAQKDIILLHATKQWWAGGAAGSGTGIKYNISIETPYGADTLALDTLWVGDHYYKVSSIYSGNIYSEKFKAGNIQFVASYHYDGYGSTRTADYNKLTPPYKYKGEALLKYRINNEVKYLEIDSLAEKRPIAYP